MEHAPAPWTIGRFVEQREPGSPDTIGRSIDISGRAHVELQVETLTFHAFPTQLAVVLIEHDLTIPGRDYRNRMSGDALASNLISLTVCVASTSWVSQGAGI